VSEGPKELMQLTAGGIRWQFLPGWQDRLFGPEGLRLEEWLRSGSAQIVKHGPHRTVYRVSLPGLNFHLKHYRLTDLRSRLRQLVRPAKARREFEQALAVAKRRVPTVVPLALGEECRSHGPSESYLITHSLTGTESLSHFIEVTLPALANGRRARLAQRLAVAMGNFLARLHQAGIVHNDLHAANVLVRVEDDDQPRLYLIDLHAVHLRRPLHWRASRDNLILLNRWFALRASRTDRYRFWRSYCRARGQVIDRPLLGTARAIVLSDAHRPPLTDLARDVETRTWLSNLRFWRHRDSRSLFSNRYYYRFRRRGMAGHAVRDLEPGILDELLADPDAPFRRADSILLKDSRSSTVADIELLVGGQRRHVIYKRFAMTSWLDRWKGLFRPQPALRSWLVGHGVRERCLPSPRPLAVFHRRRFGLECEGYLITERLAAAQDLHGFHAELARMLPRSRQAAIRNEIEAIACLVREFHRRQLSHRDLKASNILRADQQFWLIDMVGVRIYRRLPMQRRVQNLARLHASFCRDHLVSRADKLRFLRIYLQWGLLGQIGWKEWWQAIDEATQAKVLRNQRSGRPLA
jgi:tRNA A-37 threonylcarbamoyl transferase component Bud32